MKFLKINKFFYNNTKTTITKYIFFKFNYKYYLCVFYKNDINSYFNFKLANKPAIQFKNLIIIYRKFFCYI